ncbi:MAG: GDP-mannose 4,6 dehydratase [Deltaproteobacteria bacterium]|nr:GDP-mannose 4,6 dehydratase [Deltaproteobacteria bacterium]
MSLDIFITGAAGFIGSHVAQALLSRGDRVFGLDRTPSSTWRRRRGSVPRWPIPRGTRT